MKKLTEREALFAEEFIKDLNARAACVRAGYSAKSAYWRAHHLMHQPRVLEAIEKVKAERLKRTHIDADQILQILSDMVSADIADIFDEFGCLKPVQSWPRVWRMMAQGGDVQELYLKSDQGEGAGRIIRARFIDRVKPLELLGRHVSVQAFQAETEMHVHLNGVVDRLNAARNRTMLVDGDEEEAEKIN